MLPHSKIISTHPALSHVPSSSKPKQTQPASLRDYFDRSQAKSCSVSDGVDITHLAGLRSATRLYGYFYKTKIVTVEFNKTHIKAEDVIDSREAAEGGDEPTLENKVVHFKWKITELQVQWKGQSSTD